MKNSALLILAIFFALIANTQIVNIPDANFKIYLINNSSINTNGDDEIQTWEASAFSGQINAASLDINDLTGIEAFTSITRLYCEHNYITTLDLSNNTELLQLRCFYNEITFLDISTCINLFDLNCQNNSLDSLNVTNNIALTDINCFNNNLTSLDVSNNVLLIDLGCGNNNLFTLDVTNNPDIYWLNCPNNNLTTLNLSNNNSLWSLICYGNDLAYLDVSNNTDLAIIECAFNSISELDLCNNTALTKVMCYSNELISLDLRNGNNISITTFNSTNNPDLFCIDVDDENWAQINWTNKDSWANYSNDCSIGIQNDVNLSEMKIYPNPFSENIVITLNRPLDYQVKMFNSLGIQVFSENCSNDFHSISTSELPNGAYSLYIISNKETKVEMIVKQ